MRRNTTGHRNQKQERIYEAQPGNAHRDTKRDQKRKMARLAGAIGAGGVLGPLLLMFGLARTDAAAASLLLTLEGAATALMAWFIFHENFDRRIAIGLTSLVAGAVRILTNTSQCDIGIRMCRACITRIVTTNS
jgi:drug/metabolite transporter (DMT)-like permease